ncbi:Flp family type IVb pilin [Lentilitoribacter sp. Alg239-R112]|uniref:Flp family type IVb pilin n=1 Tax=Lentilitoribacter sp. Alg239-R112 TaxID=2305987 RepID=UPI0013A6B334|nr:Flp family type IVb pilin [Lentilitoribacter sp. Alg239-R112]
MLNLVRKFWSNNSGATAIEYGLIGALVSISVIAGASQMGNTLDDLYQDNTNSVRDMNIKNASK